MLAWAYERYQLAEKVEREVENVHFAWGTLRAADARIAMAEISVSGEHKLRREHQLLLLDSLHHLIQHEEQINNYVAMNDATRAKRHASKILSLLEIETVSDFEKRTAEIYQNPHSFHWDGDSGTIDADAVKFIEASLRIKACP